MANVSFWWMSPQLGYTMTTHGGWEPASVAILDFAARDIMRDRPFAVM